MAPGRALFSQDFGEKPKKQIIISKPSKELQVGENLIYTVRWMGFKIGTASLQVKEMINKNGRDVYHVIAKAQTRGLFPKVYKVEDVFESYIDKETFLPIRYEEKITFLKSSSSDDKGFSSILNLLY